MLETLLEKSVEDFSGTRILDLGPGFNQFAVKVAEKIGATEVAFVDVSEKVLKFQKDLCENQNLSCETICSPLDAQTVHGIKGTFDLILCQEIFEHLLNAEQVLEALVPKLKLGGRMIVTVPTEASERWMKTLNPHYMEDEEFGHVRTFSEVALKKMLLDSGLRIKNFSGTQPQYFLSHSWMVFTRMKVKLATGDLDTSGWKGKIFSLIMILAGWFFRVTSPKYWNRLIPRNFFVLLEKSPGSPGS